MRELFTYIMRGDMKKLFWEQSDNVMIQFFRYVFVGGVAFLVDGGSLFLLEWMGMHYLLQRVCIHFGLLANFILSKILYFVEMSRKRKCGGIFIMVELVLLGLNYRADFVRTYRTASYLFYDFEGHCGSSCISVEFCGKKIDIILMDII